MSAGRRRPRPARDHMSWPCTCPRRRSRVERCRSGNRELPLDRRHEVTRLHRCAVRVLDSLAECEGVGLAAVGRRGISVARSGTISCPRTADALELDQAVMGVDQQLPFLQRVVLSWVGDAPVRVGKDREGAALVRRASGSRTAAARPRRARAAATTAGRDGDRRDRNRELEHPSQQFTHAPPRENEFRNDQDYDARRRLMVRER